ncbi:MAG: (2Fe-2S)-binding protein, partial [Oscillospiraceae bacterium]|nr:(2Fe-2S)-binding protein [Oscillospiraceae bacterium]
MSEIKITVNGKEITGQSGDSILEIAAQNGIEIPNLCYNKKLKIYGACGLCVVEAEGVSKLLRACATVATDGMVIRTNTPRVKRARTVALELLMSDHAGDCKGPCSLNCPAHTDVQGYLKQIALGNDKEAVKIIKEKIPLPASIGRVCPHPCEEHCRRKFVEEPLSVAYL